MCMVKPLATVKVNSVRRRREHGVALLTASKVVTATSTSTKPCRPKVVAGDEGAQAHHQLCGRPRRRRVLATPRQLSAARPAAP